MARIVAIERKENQRKRVRRCPSCTKTTLKRRANLLPAYRCHSCKTAFDVPVEEDVTCVTFVARFGSTFIPTQGALAPESLKDACLAYNGQLAMQRINLERLRMALVSAVPAAGPLLEENGPSPRNAAKDRRSSTNLRAEEAEEAFEIDPELDLRTLVSRQLRARRGQTVPGGVAPPLR